MKCVTSAQNSWDAETGGSLGTDCDPIRLVNGCESSGVELNQAWGFLVQRQTSTRPPRAEFKKEKEKNNKRQPTCRRKTNSKTRDRLTRQKLRSQLSKNGNNTYQKHIYKVYNMISEAKL